MKWNQDWNLLTRDQRQTWRTWARNNPVLIENGVVRRVSGRKAFTVVQANLAIALELADPGVPPASVTWLGEALSLTDAGPFTAGEGSMTFRTAQNLLATTRWFVWATKPLPATEPDPLKWLRFVKCLPVAILATDELTDNFAPDYRAVLGSFNGPGENGAWAEDHFVWFRVHEHVDGQLGPAVVLKGRIQVEL